MLVCICVCVCVCVCMCLYIYVYIYIYILELRNRFKTRQEKTEKSTLNDEFENVVNAHLEAAAKCIPTKPRTKYRVLWEMLAVREKRAHVKTTSKSYRKNPTNTNALKLKKA